MDSNLIIDRWLPQFRKGILEFIILYKLSKKECYGFEIATIVKKLTSIELAEGTLYPLLNRLKRDEMVTTEWKISEEGNPRKYYQITQAGLNVLQEMVCIWQQTQHSIDSMINQ